MRTLITFTIVALIITGCNFSKETKKNLITRLTSAGNGLSCDDIVLKAGDEEISRSSFSYGEKLNILFNNIEGFVRESDKVFPGLRLVVADRKGDTIFQVTDLYAGYPEGVHYEPLLLTTDLTIAAPIHSGEDYTLLIRIWDKKGNGRLNMKLPFSVNPGDNMKTTVTGASFKEAYLFSGNRQEVLTDNDIAFNENIYFIIEGLTGFKEEHDLVFPGLSLRITDADRNIILDNENLFKEYSASGISPIAFAERVSCNFTLTGSEARNPVSCTVILWDQKSDARFTATAELTLSGSL